MQADVLGWLNAVNGVVWGPPTLILLVGTGLYLMAVLRGLPLRLLGHALYLALVMRRERGDEPGDPPVFSFVFAFQKFQEHRQGLERVNDCQKRRKHADKQCQFLPHRSSLLRH